MSTKLFTGPVTAGASTSQFVMTVPGSFGFMVIYANAQYKVKPASNVASGVKVQAEYSINGGTSYQAPMVLGNTHADANGDSWLLEDYSHRGHAHIQVPFASIPAGTNRVRFTLINNDAGHDAIAADHSVEFV